MVIHVYLAVYIAHACSILSLSSSRNIEVVRAIEFHNFIITSSNIDQFSKHFN